MCKKAFSLFILFVCLMSTATFGQDQEFQKQPSVDLPAELDRVLRDYESAWMNNKAAELAALFTEKGYVPSNAGWIMGREAIQNKYEKTGGDLRLRALDYDMGDGVGFIVGAYGYGDKAAEIDRGNFILALRQDDNGKWLIVADLDKGNSN